MSFRVRYLRASCSTLALACLLLASCDVIYTSEDLSIVAYTGPKISQESVVEGWSGRVTGEKVVLKSPVSLIQKEETIFITLVDRGDALPDLKDIWIGQVNGSGKTLKKARVEIQEWSLTGVVSGAVEVKMSTGVQVYEQFWIDLSSQQ